MEIDQRGTYIGEVPIWKLLGKSFGIVLYHILLSSTHIDKLGYCHLLSTRSPMARFSTILNFSAIKNYYNYFL